MVDPGFPRGGGTNPKGGGRQPIIWPIFPENCMKMKKFWAGGARVPRAPLRSATDRVYVLSPEDGSVITTALNAQQHGINYPFCVQIQCGHLYVAHLNNSEKEEWVISSFVRK